MNLAQDILEPIKDWRIIYLRATQSIRSRFSRSYFGQLWITLSLSILIISTGLVWSLIWGLPADEFLPYVAVGHVIYLFVSGTINDSATAIIGDANFYMHKKYSFFLSIYTLLTRNVIVFFYNLPIIFLVILWSSKVHFNVTFAYPFYFLLTLIFLFFMSYAIATFCIYFRDFVQLIGSIMSVAFLLTPVMWNASMIPEALRHYVYINPFAVALELLRNPLIGLPVNEYALYFMFAWIVVSIILTGLIWRTLSKNSIYWL